MSSLCKKIFRAINIRISILISKSYSIIFFRSFKKRVINFSHFKHNSKVCYIVGSGPSLEIKDLEKIHDHFSISSNRIYHIFDKTDWRPSLYLVQDEACLKTQLLDHKFVKILDSDLIFLFPQFAFSIKIIRRSKAYFYRLVDQNFKLATSEGTFFDGKTVTLSAMEMARMMGFEEIRLLGVDNSYSSKDRPQYFSKKINNIGINQPEPEEVSKNLNFITEQYKKMNIKIINYSYKSPLIIE